MLAAPPSRIPTSLPAYRQPVGPDDHLSLPESDVLHYRGRLRLGLIIGLAFAGLSLIVPRNVVKAELIWFAAHGFGLAAYGGLMCSGWRAPLPSPHAWAFRMLGMTHLIWSIIVGAILAFLSEGVARGVFGVGDVLNRIESFPVLATGVVFTIVVWTAASARGLTVMLVATAVATVMAWAFPTGRSAWIFEPLGLAAAPLHLGITLSVYREGRRRLALREWHLLGMCVSCGYDLRGIRRPICPECGSTRDPSATGIG